MTTVAVMQPYFYPYGGYYSLAQAADVFILLDDVQFPRRGFVHRNRLHGLDGSLRLLTLPLDKAPREATIDALRLRDDAQRVLRRERRRFAALAALDEADPLHRLALAPAATSLVDVLRAQLEHAFAALSIEVEIRRASEADLDPALPAAERILRLVERAGGDRYVNAPGGRELYDPRDFARRGVELSFLAPFRANPVSVLERLIVEGPEAVRRDVLAHVRESGL